MNLHGTLLANLQAALQSANRLRNQRVQTGTLDHWQAVVNEAHRVLATRVEPGDAAIRKAIAELEPIVVSRRKAGGLPVALDE